MNKQKVPKLRFPEFTGEWEEKRLREFCEINPKNSLLPNSFIYIDLEAVTSGRLLKVNKLRKEEAPSRAQRLLKKGDILYQTVRPYQKNNFYFKLKEENYVASTGYAQLRTNQNSHFLYQFLHTNNFVNKVLENCTGTNYPAINTTILSNLNISFPSLPEQEKIADFLTLFDKEMELEEKKLELLKENKKGYMQKIFSQELRFKNDNGNDYPQWEEKKLGEIVTIKKGEQLNKSCLTKQGIYPCLNGGINYSGYTDKYNTLKDTIAISEGGNSCGHINYVKTKFWSGGHCYTVLDIWENINKKNLYYYLKFNEKRIKKMRVGSGLPNIQKTDLINFKIQLPSLPEQEKIANFLSMADEEIELMENKIEKLKEIKKGLLQQMFI